MKWRVILLLSLIMAIGFSVSAWGDPGSDEDNGDDDDDDDEDGDDDDEDDEGEDKWGEAKFDHKVNVPWDYPTDYVARPLVFNRMVTLFGAGLDYKFAEQYYNEDGDLINADFEIAKQTFNVYMGIGITDKFSVMVNFPFSYKKTTIRKGANNYVPFGDNTYGVLFEEALVDYFTASEGWDLWNFEWPFLGDVTLDFTYSLFQKLEPYTTSIALESSVKFPTGNDNLRRSDEARNYIASGNTDWYNGLAIKQQAWKFSFLARAGYKWRMPADTKYANGEIDFADQVNGYGEIMFQIPEFPIIKWPGRSGWWASFAIGSGFNYMMRIGETEINPVRGETIKVGDDGGYLMEVLPKFIYHMTGSTDLTFDMKIPLAGEKSLLYNTSGFYLPPFEIESYDAVGVTYSIGIQKRFQ